MANLLLIETATEVCSVAIAAGGRVLVLAEDLQQPNHAARLTLLIEQCVQQSGITLASLDAVAVSQGPGSYTSLRVGASVAKGICYALDKPLIAVDTLQALAAADCGLGIADYGLRIADCRLPESPRTRYELSGAAPPHSKNIEQNPQSAIRNPQSVIFLPMLDARRQEVWTAVYDSALQELQPAQVLILEHNLFDEFLQRIREAHPVEWFVVSGNGAKKIGNVLVRENVVFSAIQNCSAAHLAALAERFFQQSDFQDVSYFEPFYMKMPNITTPNKPLF